MVCTLEGIVSQVRESKTYMAKTYVDFIFMGGSISLLLPPDLIQHCRTMEGQTVKVSFAVKPRQMTAFDRSITVFEPVNLLTLEKVKG